MMRIRISLVALIASMVIGGAVVSTAGAAAPAAGSTGVAPLYKLPVSGLAKNGKKFSGNYGIQRFVVATVKGKRAVYAVGTLKGTLEGRRFSRSNVMLPASLTGGSGASAARSSVRAASCTILHLVLGPINLNLLGLQVTLGGGTLANQPIVLDLTANPAGGLLGSLLCGLDNSLGASGVLSQLSSQLQSLSSTLNSLVSLVGGGA